MDARYILKSPAFLILLLMAFAFTLPAVLSASDLAGVPLYPLTIVSVPTIEASFDTILLVIAAYYGGELVWRERERKIHEIIDSTPLPAWALMLPKMLGLALVLVATLLSVWRWGSSRSCSHGGVDLAAGPISALVSSPRCGGRHAHRGARGVRVGAQPEQICRLGGDGSLHPAPDLRALDRARASPPHLRQRPVEPLSDMAGAGIHWKAAWWFRLFWAATAILLLVAVHLLWPRGTEQRLKPRLRRIPDGLSGRTGWWPPRRPRYSPRAEPGSSTIRSS